MVKRKIVYEQPLNDRMRHLLRMELLFAGLMYRLKGPAEWDSRAVIDSIIDILDLNARVELKTELINDLQSHLGALGQWQTTPKADDDRIKKIIQQINYLLEKLQSKNFQLGESFAKNQVLNQVRQRRNIIGGTCRGDLPGYFYWLQKNPKQRQEDLNEWLAPLTLLKDAIELNLYLIRQNAITSQEIALMGFYQSKLETHTSYQMIQVVLPTDHPCYPEINGGKQRFTIRFFEPTQPAKRPSQTQQDVNFELTCCMI